MQESKKVAKQSKYPGLFIPRRVSQQISTAGFTTENGCLPIMSVPKLQLLMEVLQEKKLLTGADPKLFSAGELNGMLIINTAMKLVLEKTVNALPALKDAIINDHIKQEIGDYNFAQILDLLKQTYEIDQWPNTEELHKATLINGLLVENPALKRYQEIFSAEDLNLEPAFPKFVAALKLFFQELPFPYRKTDLITFLSEPSQLYPNSIKAQVEFIRDNWGDLLGEFLNILLRGLDIIKEEEKVWLGGPGEIKAYDFSLSDEEYEKFSQDSEWMPHLVLLAKSTYVWLDQLSKKYQRNISRLDEIPTEELQILADRGFNGLWFIGVWHRSQASQKIKNISGSTDVIASAYSLADYHIAPELGGEEAMIELQHRAGRFGIRIACDMVPNHMGLDSNWVIEHPDWFLQLPYPPFPSYAFNGQNLTDRHEIEVYIEDHYYEKSDAAVVYKLYDRRDGKNRYIYHGNDGTGIPWNDTAQLNYLLPEVREAVVQNIIRIARQFPIIRFDAAMTLAKKHIQRLWFPEPGSGGDIASRAQFGLSKDEFNRLMPEEFWREVVDRIAQEAPNTLLLAEAFWMMEGYFVRTLGMHRVYNSAFMNMLKNEDNANYRKSIYNIIEFNPEILKRFVNFMSNPDEDTAIAQFGKDDKYFGVCILMITMPGLPMFAHGQVEGFTERYGMEFPRARWEESVDDYLVQRHQREIFPLLKKRIIFSEVKNFLLFDFQTDEGYVNEDVFAYSNENQDQRSLVVYNNKFSETKGRIHWANTVIRNEGDPSWVRKSLGEALNISAGSDHYLIFRDYISGLEYIRNCAEIHQSGVFQQLGAFKYAVYLDFREVQDGPERKYAQLSAYLQGGGVSNINISLKKLAYQDIYAAFKSTSGPLILKKLEEFTSQPDELKKFLPEMEYRIIQFLEILDGQSDLYLEPEKTAEEIILKLNVLFNLKMAEPTEKSHLIPWFILTETARVSKTPEQDLKLLLKDIMLANEISEILGENTGAEYLEKLYSLLFEHENSLITSTQKACWQKLLLIFQDLKVQEIIGLNNFNGIDWFNKEKLLKFTETLILINRINFQVKAKISRTAQQKFDRLILKLEKKLPELIERSDYQLKRFIDLLG